MSDSPRIGKRRTHSPQEIPESELPVELVAATDAKTGEITFFTGEIDEESEDEWLTIENPEDVVFEEGECR